ncbi:metallophosphoesterase family protein [Halococcus sediminicola]|uniref:metallophosphoesterase family protein n=1 Tax=Halococcus sediminicola TaxID=1264579 RepID=UPI000678D0A6|nr:exonuclease SbcCD subunit D [Halococcus sediminicola]
MVQIAHISDTHLGNRQYGSDVRRQDFTDAFAAAVERAVERDVDAIIHTGDLFHRRTPPLPQVNQCIGVLRRAHDAGIPFLGIVGNHDRKMDDQWLDLMAHTGTASRLDSSPTMIGEGDEAVALYGIDAVPSPAWDSTNFELDKPDNDDAYRLLCMHQLLHPPVPEIMADYPADSVIERLNIEIDGLALGDYHEAESADVNGVDVWYAGSTERGSAGEEGPRSITMLSDFSDHTMSRSHVDLDTRDFQPIQIAFEENDGYEHARSVFEEYDLTDAVAVVNLTGKRTSLTASDIHEIALDRGAAVARVDDNRGREHLDIGANPTTDVEDPDTLIDKRLAKAGLSEPALDVDQMVRDEATSTNALDDNAERLISEAQDKAFESGDPEAVLGDGPVEEPEGGDERVANARPGGGNESDDTEPTETAETLREQVETDVEAAEAEAEGSDVVASEDGESGDKPALTDMKKPAGESKSETDTAESVKERPPEARAETAPTTNESETEQTVETEATDGGNDPEDDTESASGSTNQASFADIGGSKEESQ